MLVIDRPVRNLLLNLFRRSSFEREFPRRTRPGEHCPPDDGTTHETWLALYSIFRKLEGTETLKECVEKEASVDVNLFGRLW